MSEDVGTGAGAAPGQTPLLRVVHGEPTAEELAALVTAVAARAGAAAQPTSTQQPVSAWRDRSRSMRQPLPPGPGAWRASALPR